MMIAIYILCIVAANVLATSSSITLGADIMIPAGVLVIAPIFTLRDTVQHRHGSRIAGDIVLVAALLTMLLSVPLGESRLGRVSIASLIAFVVSELLDTAIYFALHRHEWLTRVLASNTVASAIDTVLFLSIAFELSWPTFSAMYLIKLLGSTLAGVALLRWQRRTLSRD
jgi:uncharacterized PurR-regulated membrane protein YhhQ (DUF165 family)